ncbi:hypothetical protein KQH41_01170 [bacterium]|nr:hypothetical protein [bacterium]
MNDYFRKDTLTAKERLTALIAGKPLDRVPFNPCSIGFSARLVGIDRGTFYRNPKQAFAAGLHLMATFPWMNCRPSYGWADRGSWEFGGGITWPDHNRYIAPSSVPLLTSPDEIERLPVPDPATAGMNPLVACFNVLCRDHGFPASLPGGTPTTIAAGIVGRQNFLKWLVRYPEAVHALQQKVTRFLLQTAEQTITRFGAENCSVFCGVPMESNQLIPVKMFTQYAKPYIKEIFTFYREAGVKSVVIHLCGDHSANLQHWHDIPLPPRTVFSIGHEMDLARTGEAIGDQFILAGNINNEILHRGSPEEVGSEVERCLLAGMHHPGGFILMPACEFPPDTPLSNLEALASALARAGYYS